ncbi:MAG: enoyl-CoA hydratase/isomerase family protein [Acidimicrobiia bacterium]|nr:enoyl-CoA hydratase/isomerase family protein [Acidimicrobiia bacterium]
MSDRLTPADVLALTGAGLEDTALGALTDRPVVVLDLTDVSTDFARVAEVLAGRPCVVIGVAPSAILDPSVDRLVDVALCASDIAPAPWVACGDALDTTVDAVVAAIESSTEAAVALVQLLRLAERSSTTDAVVAESFVYSLLQSGDRHRAWLDTRADRGRRPRPDTPIVVLARTDDHLTVVLDRPEVHNAYGVRMRDELTDAFRLVAADPTIISVELCGAGPSFSSGGDLDEFGTAPAPLSAHLVRTTRNAGIALAAIADRVTARVHGTCVGAGVELPAFAGRVVADPHTSFLLPEVAMGLVPGAGGTASIPRRIGRHRTAYLALMGAPIDAPRALSWGLVDAIEPVTPVEPVGGR